VTRKVANAKSKPMGLGRIWVKGIPIPRVKRGGPNRLREEKPGSGKGEGESNNGLTTGQEILSPPNAGGKSTGVLNQDKTPERAVGRGLKKYNGKGVSLKK